ncbi:DASH complex, subunit Spc34 [Thozetella sp. PMI_491]|nr:DASH complex, subunit Spc34 [Thozetella sp. PMI_491]
MSLLSAHLEQISISCQGIDSLPFPGPKVFTNSLLSNHDITSLIRDTEAHERALFSVPPPQPPAISPNPDLHQPPARRQTVFNVAAGEVTTGPPKNSTRGGPRRNAAVAAVLGGDLHSQIIRRGGEGAKGDVDIEVLLKGAEKLCSVYPLHGALDRISAQRQKYAQQGNTLAYYESKVGEQQETLESMNRDPWMEEDADEGDADEGDANEGVTKSGIGLMTEEDLRREEEEVRELDRKKKELQERLHAMEKDLGGLLDL